MIKEMNVWVGYTYQYKKGDWDIEEENVLERRETLDVYVYTSCFGEGVLTDLTYYVISKK